MSAPGALAATRVSASAFARPYSVQGDGMSASTYGAPLRPSKTTSVEMCTSRAPTSAAARATFSEPSTTISPAPSPSWRYAVWITTSGRTRSRSARTAAASRTSTRSPVAPGSEPHELRAEKPARARDVQLHGAVAAFFERRCLTHSIANATVERDRESEQHALPRLLLELLAADVAEHRRVRRPEPAGDEVVAEESMPRQAARVAGRERHRGPTERDEPRDEDDVAASFLQLLLGPVEALGAPSRAGTAASTVRSPANLPIPYEMLSPIDGARPGGRGSRGQTLRSPAAGERACHDHERLARDEREERVQHRHAEDGDVAPVRARDPVDHLVEHDCILAETRTAMMAPCASA